MKKGIDLSSHNGQVDMKKVLDSGIEFLILRLGYGKYKKNIDTRFYENYQNAIELNIPVGIYLYSYAINTNDALQEAKLVIDEIKDLKIEYPIFIDMEDVDDYKEKYNVSNSTCVDICEEFCKYIESQGYYAGIYANLDWLNNKINDKRLDVFDKWIAQWNSKCSYKGEYGIWQYSSKGQVPGISGKVDLNYAYKDYPNIIRNAALNKLNQNINTGKVVRYIIQSGDNLSKIAKKFNVSVNELYELNKNIIGENPNLIKVGQELVIKE